MAQLTIAAKQVQRTWGAFCDRWPEHYGALITQDGNVEW